MTVVHGNLVGRVCVVGGEGLKAHLGEINIINSKSIFKSLSFNEYMNQKGKKVDDLMHYTITL